MTEQGAAADNAVRDGAPGGAGPLQGLVRLARRTKPGLANPAKEPIARLLAPPGAPFPHWGNGKRDEGPAPAPEKYRHGTAEHWLFDNQFRNTTARAKITAY